DGVPAEDGRRFTLTVSGPVTEELRIAAGPLAPAPDPRPDALLALLTSAQYGHDAKLTLWKILSSDLPEGAKLAALQAEDVPPALLSAITELMSVR
ncbi:hypothetical protein, partial [Actinocorallia lasiicapitis]